ncbi:FAD/NAD(P)-binding domain-containing protein [Tuber magnatum]|uniref:FAD/NAD(P)-binding domain-containing protein n=1 Tax=Tuber magnatum TaxID=42249 RepID=A0A317SD54_9PEZI|nr:FAD/NAD(P)-binding domain-containing protein [Tuber magnatum]
MKRKTAAVIGAGPAGLTTAKSLLASGIQPTVFERRKAVGGLWSPAAGSVTLNPGMRTNLSRYSCVLPELAYDPSVAMLPTAREVGEYLGEFRRRYIPDECLRLGCAVVKVERVEGGGWSVGWRKEEEGGEEGKGEFDFLVICSGFYSVPYMPPMPMERFTGSVLHSIEYLWPHEKLSGKKKIVVVGGSMSGVEVAADIALRVSSLPEEERAGIELVHLFTRPFWIIPRFLPIAHREDPSAPHFVPDDIALYDVNRPRKNPMPMDKTQEEKNILINTFISSLVGGRQGDIHQNLHMTDDHMSYTPWVAISDSYLEFVRSGAIKPVIGRLGGADGSTLRTNTGEITDVDTILLGTGFYPSASLQRFLPEDLYRDLTSNDPGLAEDSNFLPLLLYKQCLHPSFGNTGGLVGMYKGPFFGIIELQGRWMAGLLSGKLPWPSIQEMELGISESRATRTSRIAACTPEARIQWSMGDYMALVDELRRTIGLPILPEVNEAYPNTMSPAHFSPGHEEAEKTLREMAERLTERWGEDEAKDGILSRAIFKALHGRWKLRRKIVSRHPGFSSGTFEGVAEFLPRPPSFSCTPPPVGDGDTNSGVSDQEEPLACANITITPSTPLPPVYSGEVQEYLYTETGTFTTAPTPTIPTPLTIQARRSYIYRHHPVQDAITVWFVKPEDSSRVDYFFHRVEISGRAKDGKGGWVGGGKHLCRADWYWPRYRFWFNGGGGSGGKAGDGGLKGFEIGYGVKGPKKEYDSDGVYERV